MTGLTVNGNLTVTGNTSLKSTTATTLNISATPTTDTGTTSNYLTRDGATGEVKIKTIPNTFNYGLFSQTGSSQTVSGTTTETSIIGGGIGSLNVPPNTFNIGDSFRGDLGGILTNGNNQTIRVKLKSGSIILSDSGVQTLSQHTGDIFKLEVNFTIRNIGGSGNASIITLGYFQTVKKNSSDLTGFGFEFINNSTFDTTAPNTLDITVEWGSTSTGNSIKSEVFILNRVY
jgi:hypothetical protein